jgi:hypothetical protein
MIFDKNISIVGKHSYYLDLLKESGLFKRHLDVYINAVIVGFQYNRISQEDNKSEHFKDARTQIHTEQLVKETTTLEFIYRLIMLLDKKETISIEDRISRAFREDAIEEISDKHQENMHLFKSYVLGGLEILYEKILEKGTTDQDYMKNAYEFIKEQHLSFTSVNADDVINKL